MNHKKGNNGAEKHGLKKRLSADVHVILSGCLHQFEDTDKDEDQVCFNVDAIIAGRTTEARQLKERFTGRTEEVDRSAFKAYPGSLSRGSFIPHMQMFNHVVRAAI